MLAADEDDHAERLYREVGRMAVNAGRVEDLIASTFEHAVWDPVTDFDISPWLSGDFARMTWEVPARTVEERLRVRLGKPKLRLEQLKERRWAMLRLLRDAGLEGLPLYVEVEDWFKRADDAQRVRNDCIHDPWIELREVASFASFATYTRTDDGAVEPRSVENAAWAADTYRTLLIEWERLQPQVLEAVTHPRPG